MCSPSSARVVVLNDWWRGRARDWLGAMMRNDASLVNERARNEARRSISGVICCLVTDIHGFFVIGFMFRNRLVEGLH